ncbi:MAG: hypothetical protein LLF96_03505 [Eubacteriales bacterium]|nr:hypothetical protein [Eubacteriales bacterium]
MKKVILYSWSEQVIGFESEADRAAYVNMQIETAKRKRQAPVQVLDDYEENGLYLVRLRKPYNRNPIFDQ